MEHNKIELFLKYDQLQKEFHALDNGTEEYKELRRKAYELRQRLYTEQFKNHLNACRVGHVIYDLGDRHIIVDKNRNCEHKILVIRKKTYAKKKSTLQHFDTFEQIESSLGTDKCALTYYCQTLDKLNEIENELELLRRVKEYVIQNDIVSHDDYRIKITKAPNGFKVRLV